MVDKMIKTLQQAISDGIKENTVYNCDCLNLMELMKQGSIDLIYIDPPFGIKKDDNFGDSYNIESNDSSNGCDDIFKMSLLKQREQRFVRFLYDRLILMKSLLKETGSIYVHLDWHVGHYVKLIMDDIFGKEKFRNEVIWCYTGPGRQQKDFPDKHDVIYRYSKSDNYIFNFDNIRIPYVKLDTGKTHGIFKKQALLNERGKIPEDWWSDITPVARLHATELLNYGTQKPEALLERIIKASSNEGNLVTDFFCGSGTSCAVSEKLDRRWIGCDLNKKACEITENRIKNIRNR